MSNVYASNADSVRDFLDNYNDEGIQSMEDMTDSVASLNNLKWKDKAEGLRAKAQHEAMKGGEVLGGLMGVKGLKGGLQKIKSVYQKGKALKKNLGDLKDKADDALGDAKNKVGDLGKEVQDRTKQVGGDQDEADRDIGNDVSVDEGSVPNVDTEAGDLGDDVLGDLSDTARSTLNDLFTGGSQSSGYSDLAERYQNFRNNPVNNQDDAGDTRNTDAGDHNVFDNDTGEKDELDKALDDGEQGGTLEGRFRIPEKVTAKDGRLPAEPDIDDLPPQGSKTFSNNQFDDPADEPSYKSSGEKIGGDQDLDTYSADVPDSYTRETDVPQSTESSRSARRIKPADEVEKVGKEEDDVTDLGVGDKPLYQPRSMNTNIVQNERIRSTKYDLDQPELTDRPEFSDERDPDPILDYKPSTSSSDNAVSTEADNPADAPDISLYPTEPTGDFTLTSNPLFSRPDLQVESPAQDSNTLQTDSVTSNQEGSQSTFRNAKLSNEDVGDSINDESGYGGDVENFVQQAKSKVQSIADQGSNMLKKIGSSGGDDLADDVGSGLLDTATAGGEEAGLVGLDTIASAVPVLGEVALVGTGLYEGIKGLFDLFDPDSSKPPPVKTLGDVANGVNPLSFGGGVSSRLSSAIPTADDVLDRSGMESF